MYFFYYKKSPTPSHPSSPTPPNYVLSKQNQAQQIPPHAQQQEDRKSPEDKVCWCRHCKGQGIRAKSNTKETGMGSLTKHWYNLYQFINTLGAHQPPREQTKLTIQLKPLPYAGSSYQESLGSPNSFTVPASRLLSYLPSLSSQANASRGLLGCQATVKVGDSHWTSHSLSPIKINIGISISMLTVDHTH